MRITKMEPGHDDLGAADWQLLPRLQRACRCRLDRTGTSNAAVLDDLSGFSDDAAANLTRRATQLVQAPRPGDGMSGLVSVVVMLLSEPHMRRRHRSCRPCELDPDLEALVPLALTRLEVRHCVPVR
ncbi:hypothetical protein [Amycolatopsis sp. NPDC004625]|uniref:hypothetical protein n=1 Tax=Amycolatopsis sp. NPDC004625 TaxID=3154670 RepID=UPI0033AD414C